MKTSLNEMLISVIEKSLPSEKKIVSYLMNLLNLSRESAYRRIRNDIPFTFKEIIAISLDLGFSIDEMIGQNIQDRIFIDVPVSKSIDPVENYTEMLEASISLYKKLSEHSDSSLIYALNQPIFSSFMNLELLQKFHFYRWKDRMQDMPLGFYFSDFELPSQITAIHKKYRYYFTKLNNMTLILCPNTTHSVVREINYFYRRMLISKEELMKLQNEMLRSIDVFEKETQKGISENGIKLDIYVSRLHIPSNSIWSKYNNGKSAVQFFNNIFPATIYDSRISNNHKKWIDCLLKYSTLISQSNEIQRSEFFNKQREYVNTIENFNLY